MELEHSKAMAQSYGTTLWHKPQTLLLKICMAPKSKHLLHSSKSRALASYKNNIMGSILVYF
jgi:hypothetical protein